MSLRLVLYAAWATGLALFVGLIVYQGLGDILTVLATAGWGLGWVIAFHLVPFVADVIGWRALLPGAHRRSLTELSWMRWIGESINSLLPVAQVGGDLVRARLLRRSGVPGGAAGASVIVDVTAGVMMLIPFALLGVGLLLQEGGTARAAAELGFGIAIIAIVIASFYLAQRAGVFLACARAVEKLAKGREWCSLTGGAAALDAKVAAIYARPMAVGFACGWRLLGWLLGAGEVWLALYFLGHPVTLTDALILESLGQAIRTAAFVIPGALGVQEGGFVVLGGMLGLPPETSLAVSLVKRVRELALGLPSLIAWQIVEGRRAWHRQAPEA
jgi:putative membrane protein